MKKTISILMLLIAAVPLGTQNKYNEEDKEDLRAFFRQGTNWQKMGLTEADTATGYDDETWIENFRTYEYMKYIVRFGQSYSRITNFITESNLDLEGKFILRSPSVNSIGAPSNQLTEVSAPNSKVMKDYQCANNKMRFSTIQYFEAPPATFTYAPQAVIDGGVKFYLDTIDLSAEYDIHGHITTFEWFDITDGTEENIVQPTNNNGVFSFTEEHAEKKLRCKMLNDAFPDLTQIYEVEMTTTGIAETIYTNILLSPNPSNNTTTLSLDLEKAGDLQITLTNITGQEVLQLYNSFADIGAFTKVFSVADLPSGTYFIRLQLGDNTKYEKLIVK